MFLFVLVMLHMGYRYNDIKHTFIMILINWNKLQDLVKNTDWESLQEEE